MKKSRKKDNNTKILTNFAQYNILCINAFK